MNIAKDERAKLGDKNAIENEIERIKTKIEDLTKNAGWTPDEKVSYDKLVVEKKEKETSIKTLEQADTEYDRLNIYIQEHVKNKIDNALDFTSGNDIVSRKFEIFKALLFRLLSKLAVLSAINIGKKKQLNEVLINSLKTRIDNINIALDPLMKKNAVQDEITKLELAKKEEENKIKEIEKKDLEIKNIRSQISDLKFIANNNAIIDVYYQLSTSLNEAIANKWNEETTKLDIKAKTEFNNVVFVDSISGVVNLKSYLSNQFGNEIFNTNDYEYQKENHSARISKLIQYATKEDDRFLNFKQGKTTKEFLSAILKDCFTIEYDIKKGRDSIHSMSEGKKGIVILQLYLSLSKSDCPILIDQPEDNLDNRTVYQDLNDYIKQCKQKRQIIMVSHNANLVVNTDAENIIVANQNGENGSDNKKYTFEYVNGSLENTFTNDTAVGVLYKQGIREHVCEILEGGVDAFKKREEKYHIRK